MADPIDHEQEITDGIGIVKGGSIMPADNATFDHDEVKGPDPKVWGPDDERPSSTTIPTSNIGDDGEEIEVKGPDPAQWGS